MAKFLIVLCSFIACATAEPSLFAPLCAQLVGAPLATTAVHAPLDAAYASGRLDIQQKYGAALFAATPAKLVVSSSIAGPLFAPNATPLAAGPAKLVASAPVTLPLAAPVTAPLAYTNVPLDAAYASSRLDINQRYGAALVPTTFHVAPAKLVASTAVPAPLAAPIASPLSVAPTKLVASAPVAAPVAAHLAYTNLPLDAAYASHRLDINQRFGSALVPTVVLNAPAKLVASVPAPSTLFAPLAAPGKLVAAAPSAVPVATPLAAASAKLSTSSLVAAPLAAPVAAPLATTAAKIVNPANIPIASVLYAQVAAPLAYTNIPLDAAYASSRLDINQRYAAAFVHSNLAVAPAKLVASAPVVAPLIARVSAPLAAGPAKLVASARVAAPVVHPNRPYLRTPVAQEAPLKYTEAKVSEI